MKNQQAGRALDLIDEFLDEHDLAAEKKQKILATKLNILNARKNYEEMETVIDAIIAVDPESDYARQIAAFKRTKLQELKAQADEEE